MSDDGPSPAAQWAYIFNVFGEETLREILLDAAVTLNEKDDERRVIEFSDDKALDVTEHYGQLESKVKQADTWVGTGQPPTQ